MGDKAIPKISILISISIWSFWRISISISIRQFCKISISIKYRIDSNLAYRTGLGITECFCIHTRVVTFCAAGVTESLEYYNLSSFLGIFPGTKLWQYMCQTDIG